MDDSKHDGTWPFTENNHLAHGTVVRNGTRFFFTKIGECSRPPGNPFHESVHAARLVSQAFGPDLVLCMSGGVDSECMAIAFSHAGVPFTAAIARYSGGWNDADIGHAHAFCDKHGIKTKTIDIDLESFFDSGRHLEYGRLYDCRSPQFAVHIELLSRLDGVPVLAWNPTEVDVHPGLLAPDILLPSEPHMALQRYFTRSRRPGVPFFFAYTPELIHSFWLTPQFSRDLETARLESLRRRRWRRWPKILRPRPRPVSTYHGKIRKFQEAGFRVQPRDGKRTGFEEAKVFFRRRLREQGRIGPFFRGDAFDLFYRRPLERLNPYPPGYLRLFSRTYFPKPELFEPGADE